MPLLTPEKNSKSGTGSIFNDKELLLNSKQASASETKEAPTSYTGGNLIDIGTLQPV